MDKFKFEKFENINLEDSFFDSLKNDYKEFSEWFNKKKNVGESAYVQTVNEVLEGFLYLKEEKEEEFNDITPKIESSKVVKIGTMKINPHGTRLGERFIKKTLDFAISKDINMIYVTVFDHHQGLMNLYLKYGFEVWGEKQSENGTEVVLVKNLEKKHNDVFKDYPKVNLKNSYLISIYPEFHTRMFSDSILNTESHDILEDVSYTNSIEKIYLCRMSKASNIEAGDNIIIYRTTPISGEAEYKSVATSICTVTNVKMKSSFANITDYLEFCKNYSIFTKEELINFYNQSYNWIIIKMLYNIALPKRVTRHSLIEDVGIQRNQYWGVVEILNSEVGKIVDISEVNKNYIF